MNFLAAVVIGVVIGLAGGLYARSKQANAIWLAPVAAIVGAVLASVLATTLGDPADYGWKEKLLQVILALVAAGAVLTPALRGGGAATASEPAATTEKAEASQDKAAESADAATPADDADKTAADKTAADETADKDEAAGKSDKK